VATYDTSVGLRHRRTDDLVWRYGALRYVNRAVETAGVSYLRDAGTYTVTAADVRKSRTPLLGFVVHSLDNESYDKIELLTH